MAQLEGNSGKKDVSATGSKDPVTEASSTANNVFAQNEVKATPSISDTPLFQTTLKQEETAAASKFAESVWKPLNTAEKDKDKDELPSPQAFGIAATETARAEVKAQVDVSKSTGALFRSGLGDNEQGINKVIAVETGDKQASNKVIATNGGEKVVSQAFEKVPVDGGKKDIGPATTLGAVADSITRDATAGSSGQLKANTNEFLKAGAQGLAKSAEFNSTPRNDVRPLIKTDSVPNQVLNQKIDAGEAASRAQRTFSLDATPPVRVEANPVIKTTQVFQPPDKIVTAGGGFFEIPDAKGKPAVELGKGVVELGKPLGDTNKSTVEVSKSAVEIGKPAYGLQAQPSVSGDVTVSAQKNLVPTSYDMPPRLQVDKPAIVQSITSKQEINAVREVSDGGGVAQNVSLGKVADYGTSKADIVTNRSEPIFVSRGAEALAPAIKQNVGTENFVKAPVNELKSSGFEPKSQIGDGASYAKQIEPNIVKSGISVEQSALKDLIKGGSADVGSINNIQTQRFEPGKSYNPQAESLKIYDGSKSAAALGVNLKQNVSEGDFGKKFGLDVMPTSKSLANNLQEPPRGFIDSGSGKPSIIYPKPIEGGPVNFKDPQIGSKPDNIKPFTTAQDFGSNGAGKIVDGSQLVPSGPGKFDKVISGNEIKQPADGGSIIGKPTAPIGQIDAGSLKPLPNLEIGKNPGGHVGDGGEKLVQTRPNQPGTSGGDVTAKPPVTDSVSRTPPGTVPADNLNRQLPGTTDIGSKPATPSDGSSFKPSTPADGSSVKPGVVVSPIDGSIKPVSPVNPLNPGANAPETKFPEPKVSAPNVEVPKTDINTDLPRTATPPVDVKQAQVTPKLDTPAPKGPVTVGDTIKAPATAIDSSKVPAGFDSGKTPATVKDGAKTPVTAGDASVPKTAIKVADATTISDLTGKPSGRTNAVDPVTAFEQSTQRVRQLSDARFDAGMRSGPLESVLNGRVTQVRDLGADGAGRLSAIDGAKNANGARLDFDVRAESARNSSTSRGITADGPATRRSAETVVSGREPQLTSFEPQGKNISSKFDPSGNRVADVRDPQGRVDAANPTAGIGRIPLSGSVKVADFQPGSTAQSVDGRVVGDVGKLPGVRGFGAVGDGKSFVSHGEIRAPRGESHRYITGLELALILSIAGIAKIRHDARSGAARMEGRTWSITRQNGRPLIYIDGRQNPLQPQRAFGKGDGSFRIMVSTTGDQAAKLSTRTMRTTDIAQTKTADAAGKNALNLGLLGKYHYLNYFGKNMPSMNYYGQFRSTSYTGSMGLAFVMAASGMTRPAGGMETVQGMERLNPVTMGPADRIRMQNQSLLTQFGKFNLDAALSSSANGRDIREKEGKDEQQDNSLSVLDDYQDFLNRLDGFSRKKEETEDEAAIINRRLSFGVDELYDETKEDDKAENIIEKDDTNGNALSQVLRRPKWVIQAGETLDGLAERFFANADLGWLIADLNRALVRETYIDNKRIVELQSRLEIELPVWQDIQKFNQNRKKNWTAENLVTIVVERQIDLEVVESTLAKVVGAEA
ncbi:hypothetical protein KF728_03495 [Candidatus Obscuribacterales bacterium]|nr:hypothetical protein [Candidatus Obscuribacterales bacterium]